MPLHFTGLVSRHNLRHPDEETPSPPVYDHVLKYNPHHGPDGRFSSGGGGMNMRRGGTEGPPTEDAFGNPLKPRRGPTAQQRANIARDIEKYKDKLSPESYNKFKALAGGAKPAPPKVPIPNPYNIPGLESADQPYVPRPVPMPNVGGQFTGDPHFSRTPTTPFTGDPGFSRGDSPYTPAANPAAISISNAGRRASAQAVFQSSAKTPLNRAISKVPLKQRAEAARQFVKQQRRAEFKALGKRS